MGLASLTLLHITIELFEIFIIQVLYEYIYPWIRGIAVDSHDYDREEPEAAELRLAAGFLVVLLISKYSLSLDEKDVIKLYHALCLRPDKNHDLHDLKGLAKHYNKMKRLVWFTRFTY